MNPEYSDHHCLKKFENKEQLKENKDFITAKTKDDEKATAISLGSFKAFNRIRTKYHPVLLSFIFSQLLSCRLCCIM